MTFPIKEESELSIHVAAAKRREAARWATLEMARLCARHHPQLAQAWVERKREELEPEEKPLVVRKPKPVARYSRFREGRIVFIGNAYSMRTELRKPMTVEWRTRLILAAVARKHGVTALDIISDKRTRAIARARQEAVWRLSTKLSMTLSQIGRRLNGRDHTTIRHCKIKFEERMAEVGRA